MRRHRRKAPPVPKVYRASDELLQYRPEVDGLRAVAVLAVLGFHAFPQYVPGGFVGVDVFFVISGYLISGIILRNLARSQFSLTDFYVRRARRILPALAVVLASCLLFGAWVLLPDEFTNLGKHTMAAAAFVANLAFWRESGYFAPAAELEPLLHLWSLGIEEQFYLLWPVLLLLVWRRRINLVLAIAVLSAGSFALNLILVDTHMTSAFYLPLSRFWELGLGSLLAAMELHSKPRAEQRESATPRSHWYPAQAISPMLPIAGMVLIGMAIVSFDTHTPFPGVAALLPTLGTVCVIAAPGHAWFSRKVLSHRALVFVGLISYPLYLWHWPVLSFLAILESATPAVYLRAAGVLFSVILAVLTFRFVEIPIRTYRHTRVSGALVSATATAGLAGLLVFAQQGFPGRFIGDVTAIRQGPGEDTLCRESIPESRDSNYCRRTTAQPPAVAFLGDSQAQGVYEGAISTLGADKPMVLLGRGGCAPVLNVQPSPAAYDSDQHREACNATWTAFVDYVRKTRPPVVVLTGDGARFFAEPAGGSKPHTPGTQQDERAFEAGLDSLVAALQPSSRVIYLLEIPTFDSPPSCLLRPIRLPGSTCSPQVPREALAASRARYTETVRKIQREHPDLTVIDSIPSLCGAKSCSQVSRGQILYSDKMHLSPAGGRLLAQRSGLSKVIADDSGPARE
jgi:peptidoglycan/LPS O-acetylase OafA/YrhL